MAVINVSGVDISLRLNGIEVGCASSVTLSLTTAMNAAACKATGGWDENVPGRHSWTADVDGLVRVATGTDIAGNRTYTDIMGLQIARTPVTVVVTSAITGDTMYTGTAYLTSTSKSAPLDGNATFTSSLVGSGPLVPSAVPA